MSKFCGHCGASLADNATFCPNCGAPAADQGMPQQQFAQPQQPFGGQPAFQQAMPGAAKAGMSKGAKTAIICAIGAVAIGLIVWLVIALVGGGYKKPIDNYINSFMKQDADLFVDALTPGGDVGTLLGSTSETSLRRNFTTYLRNMTNTYGETINISYEILEKTELTSAETLGVYEGYKLKIKFLIKGSKYEKTKTKTIRVIKMGGKWSINSAFDLSY